MCSAKSLIDDVAVQMVLSLHHQNFHFLFKYSNLSTINTFTFFSNGLVSTSSKLLLSIQMVLPLHYQNFHFHTSKYSLVFHYLPGIV